jgi:hypothetical protein
MWAVVSNAAEDILVLRGSVWLDDYYTECLLRSTSLAYSRVCVDPVRVKIKDSGRKSEATNRTMGPFVGRWGLVRSQASGPCLPILSTYQVPSSWWCIHQPATRYLS